MTNRDKLQNLLYKLQGKDPKELEAFRVFENEVKKLQDNLHENVKVSTLDEVNSKINKVKKQLDLAPLLTAFEELKSQIKERNDKRDTNLKAELKSQLKELKQTLSDTQGLTDDRILDIIKEGGQIQSRLADLENKEPLDFTPQIKEAEDRLMNLIVLVQSNIEEKEKLNDKEVQKQITGLAQSLEKLRLLVTSRGGGSMNRQILIGNVDPLKRYTDINLKAGSNVTITYANNDQTKKVDVTIASSGGGGGSIRSINTISTDTTAGGTAGTDYVYLVSGTTTLTLPTAVGNTNLYTIKNVGTGVVTVATTSAQTIDNATTQVMPVQFTSIDVISDTANWNIT